MSAAQARRDVLQATSMETLANMPADPAPALADVMGASHGHVADWPASFLAEATPDNRDCQYNSLELAERALDFLFPWRKSSYPGRRKGFLALLPRSYTWGAVQHWMRGRAPMPADVSLSLADHLTKRAEAAFAIADGLRASADRQASEQRANGFCSVGADGKDRRGHWRR